MNVFAFSTPARPEWRWRIVNYAGETIEESRESFGSIALAVRAGTRRMTEMNVDDVSERSFTYARSTSHLRNR